MGVVETAIEGVFPKLSKASKLSAHLEVTIFTCRGHRQSVRRSREMRRTRFRQWIRPGQKSDKQIRRAP